MKAYKQIRAFKTSIDRNTSQEGESIEEKMRRILNNKEPITDGAPIIYTERKDGVIPAYNIRTDKMEIAVMAADAIYQQNLAKREDGIKQRSDLGKQAKAGMDKEDNKDNKDTGGEPINASDTK